MVLGLLISRATDSKMVKFIVSKMRPGRGFSHAFHLSFLAILPIVLFGLVRLDFNLLALIVLLLSKWRMFALHPRHWIAHVRTNAVDIIVGLSLLTFLIDTSSIIVQILWVVLFELWLLVLKPRSDTGSVALQAMIGQSLGAISIFIALEDVMLGVLVLGFWVISYFCARHFFNAFEEVDGRLSAAIWAFFTGSLVWVLGHWLLFVGPIAQPAIITMIVGYALGGMYYLNYRKKLTILVRRQIILTAFALLFVVVIFSDWGDKTI